DTMVPATPRSLQPSSPELSAGQGKCPEKDKGRGPEHQERRGQIHQEHVLHHVNGGQLRAQGINRRNQSRDAGENSQGKSRCLPGADGPSSSRSLPYPSNTDRVKGGEQREVQK